MSSLWASLVLITYRYPKAVSVARAVLEHPSLNMIVGSGAAEFAVSQGFSMESNSSLLSEATTKAYEVAPKL